jgi:TRAP-type mannitol/chloroaromatic compound transport system permease small subunit
MEFWLSVARRIDRVSRFFGIIAAWLVLLSCLISAGNAASRYILSISSNAWLEIQWQMFAGIFLLGTAQVLKLNEHVRVDMIYGGRSPRTKLWIDVFGLILFMFPAAIMMMVMGSEFFFDAYRRSEISSNAGGLPLWPVKFLLPLGFLLLILQGVAELIKRIAGLRGHAAFDPTYERPLQ